MVRYALRIALPPGAARPRLWRRCVPPSPTQGWRIRDARHAAPGVSRFVEQTGLFLTLVGLTSLLVGGIGVATGVRAWLEARGRSIATLRCLGASAALVFWVCLMQILALTALGIVVGLAAGRRCPRCSPGCSGRAAGAAAARAVPAPLAQAAGLACSPR